MLDMAVVAQYRVGHGSSGTQYRVGHGSYGYDQGYGRLIMTGFYV